MALTCKWTLFCSVYSRCKGAGAGWPGHRHMTGRFWVRGMITMFPHLTSCSRFVKFPHWSETWKVLTVPLTCCCITHSISRHLLSCRDGRTTSRNCDSVRTWARRLRRSKSLLKVVNKRSRGGNKGRGCQRGGLKGEVCCNPLHSIIPAPLCFSL